MSAHEQPHETLETHTTERIDQASTDFSPVLIEASIKANLEPFHAQTSTLTQMMNKLI